MYLVKSTSWMPEPLRFVLHFFSPTTYKQILLHYKNFPDNILNYIMLILHGKICPDYYYCTNL